MSQSTANRPVSGGRRVIREASNCSLEFLPDEKDERKPSGKGKSSSTTGAKSSSSRPKLGSGRSGQRAPPLADSAYSARTPTPTKQVALTARRKENDDERGDASFCDFDIEEYRENEKRQLDAMKRMGQKTTISQPREDLKQDKNIESGMSSSAVDSSLSSSSVPSSATEGASGSEDDPGQKSGKAFLTDAIGDFNKYSEGKGAKPKNKNKNCASNDPKTTAVDNLEDSDAFDTDLESGESSSEESEVEEKRAAPNELLMEFIECVMQGDYENAQKLCRMILLFEPDHPEALKFKGVIEEKIALEVELANASSSEDEEYDEEDDSSDEGSDTDSDSDSTDSSDDSDSEDKPKQQPGTSKPKTQDK